MKTVREIIEILSKCDPDAYVGAYLSMTEDDGVVTEVIEKTTLNTEYGYCLEEYGCQGDSMVAYEMTKDTNKKFVVLYC